MIFGKKPRRLKRPSGNSKHLSSDDPNDYKDQGRDRISSISATQTTNQQRLMSSGNHVERPQRSDRLNSIPLAHSGLVTKWQTVS